ncbi:hypothetical protein U9R90_05335 [Streptomyces sp. E11-3]|uniref:hypothetical protein n=1 Tax=Streptomyces sp. E11-3 TaxID=3110112 RepID=UPI00397F739A
MTVEPTRIEDLDDEQRQPFNGITNVVIFEETELAHALAAWARQVQAAITALMHAYAQAIRPAMKELDRTLQTLRDAGLVHEDGKPTKRPDRPA